MVMKPVGTVFYRISKRPLDIAGALILIVITLPLFLLIVILIKCESSGPAIFKQQRVGQGLKQFVMYKFRSMKIASDENVHQEFIETLMKASAQQAEDGVFKMSRDPRMTRVGRWIRKLSLDELPQIWNILLGQMSLVGPRPAIPYELPYHTEEMLQRFRAKPGITGWWQVNGRSLTDYRKMVEYDLYYADHAGFLLDWWIMLRTPFVIFQVKKAC